MSADAKAKAKPGPGTGARLLIDLGPLLAFFLTNFFAPVPDTLKIFVATGVFMVAMMAAMLIRVVLPAPFGPSKAKISPLAMSRSSGFNASSPDL